jgi:hypothetical protein
MRKPRGPCRAILIKDGEALRLAYNRAVAEQRTTTSAVVLTICEALRGSRFDIQDTGQGGPDQSNVAANSPTSGGPRVDWRRGLTVK